MFAHRTPTGWIGVDAGSSCVKLAQVTRQKGRFELRHAAIVPRGEAWSGGCSSLREIESAIAIASARGRRAAGVLSMAACEVVPGRELQPAGAPSAAPPSTATWQADDSAGDDGWYTLTADGDAAGRFCQDLRRAGLSCRTIDGATHALARAAALATNDAGRQVAGVVDWGYSGALYCSVQDGRPVYVRRLKGCGIDAIESEMGEELRLTPTETRQLIADAHKQPGSAAAELLTEFAQPVLERLGDELTKTLRHLKSHRRGMSPERVSLFGGGAALGAHHTLTERADLPVEPWALPGADDPVAGPQCLFAQAAALSALAWEQKR